MKSSWIFVTAGLGEENFKQASERLAIQVAKFKKFQNIVILKDENLSELCPIIFQTYAKYLRPDVRGFGYMAWKAEVVYRLLAKGDVTGIVWADCGCEASVNLITKYQLSRMQNIAIREGYLAFTLDTPEFQFTKRVAFEKFQKIDPIDATPQFQTTFFALSGPIGLSIAKRWFEVVSSSIYMVNEERGSERSDYIAHRHDQSIFSLCMKERRLISNLPPLKNGEGSRLKKCLIQLTQPFIAARNRTGRSLLFFDNGGRG